MHTYNIAKVSQLGTHDEKFGSSFWADTQEQLEPVKFNLMQGNPQAGDRITAEELVLKTSSKGTKYHQLKKVKIVGSTSDERSSQPSTGAMSESQFNQLKELLEENNKMLKQLTGTEEQLEDFPEY